MKVNYFYSFVLIILGIVCGSNAPKMNSISTKTEIVPVNQHIRGLGQLKSVEDAGYPIVVLTFDMAEGSIFSFNLNLEQVKEVNMQTLNGLIGKELSFDYSTHATNALLDLRRGGKSIIDANGFEMTDDTKTIKGIFSGAAEETAGDLPTEVYITTEEEYQLPFEMFVTREMVDANGSEVVGYYEERTTATIYSINVGQKRPPISGGK